MKKIIIFLINYLIIEAITFIAFGVYTLEQVKVKENLFINEQIAKKATNQKLSKITAPCLFFAFGRVIVVSMLAVSTFLIQDKPSQQQKPQE